MSVVRKTYDCQGPHRHDPGEDVDWQSDGLCGAEYSPTETEDGEFGKGYGKAVENLADKEVFEKGGDEVEVQGLVMFAVALMDP